MSSTQESIDGLNESLCERLDTLTDAVRRLADAAEDIADMISFLDEQTGAMDHLHHNRQQRTG